MRNHETKILRPDSKGRVHLGALAQGVSGYKMNVNKQTHAITLSPYVEIPLTENWLFENPKALESVKRGLRDSAEGKLVDRSSFANDVKEEK